MMYRIDFTEDAKSDIAKLKRSEPKAYKKLLQLLDELHIHPTTGIGRPKQLSEDRKGQWSRRITSKHRLVYKIEEKTIYVLVLSAYGHYADK